MKNIIWVCVLLLYSGGPVAAESFEMATLETNDLRLLYFDPIQTYLTPHVTRSFTNSMAYQKEVFDWDPWEPVTVLLKDFSDYGNAAAGAAPNNRILVDIAPISRSFETFTASERMYMLMNHELTHVATMDVWNKQDARWRKFFRGKVVPTDENPLTIWYSYLTTPRTAVPRWLLEGSAVFMETWMAGGLGRAQGAYDEMVFRSMVRDDAHFYDPLGLASEGTKIDFQVGVNAYLYGTRFISYLGLEYSPQHVVDWLKRGEGSKRYYSKQFLHVFGKTLEDVWQEWIAWEREFQRANLESVRQFPLTQHQDITSTALGSVSRAYLDPDGETLYGGFRYPGVVGHIGALSLEDGGIDRLVDIKRPMLYRVTSPAYDAKTQTLFYTADNHAFRDLMAVDLTTGRDRMLIRDGRIGELVFNPADGALWGVRHLNGFATLVKLVAPYDQWTQVHTFSYGTALYDLDISPDGQMLSASMGEVTGNQYLRVFKLADIESGNLNHVAQYDFGVAVPEGFVFSTDGKYLYGSSYYTGVSNIFRYEVATGEIEAVSNAETGYFRPLPLEDGRLVVFHYTGLGFVPAFIDPVPLEHVGNVRFLGAEIARKHPIVQEWQVGSPMEVDFEEVVTNRSVYRPLSEMGLETAYPIVEGYRDREAYGYHLEFADPYQFYRLGITGSYTTSGSTPDDEDEHFTVDFETLYWHYGYRHNGADFYDLAGPTERSRKGETLFVQFEKALIYDPPRQLDFSAGVYAFKDLDTLPRFQNVGSPSDELYGFELSLDGSHTRSSLGHIDDEKGHQWNVTLGAEHPSKGDTIGSLRGKYDFGLPLPWKHSSIWLRSHAGFSDGDRDDPFANFFFGGYGNNYVDDLEVKRYREWFAFPGIDLNEVGGKNFVKSTLEWNLPPVRFRNVGTPGFFMSHARPAVFLGGLVTNPDSDFLRRTLTDIGFQVDFNFDVVHRLPMTFSVGFAVGFEDGEKLDDEWLFSLKIL